MRERFASVRTTALNTDASATVRPMTHYVETTAEISTLFDNIAYAKCRLNVKFKGSLINSTNFDP